MHGKIVLFSQNIPWEILNSHIFIPNKFHVKKKYIIQPCTSNLPTVLKLWACVKVTCRYYPAATARRESYHLLRLSSSHSSSGSTIWIILRSLSSAYKTWGAHVFNIGCSDIVLEILTITGRLRYNSKKFVFYLSLDASLITSFAATYNRKSDGDIWSSHVIHFYIHSTADTHFDSCDEVDAASSLILHSADQLPLAVWQRPWHHNHTVSLFSSSLYFSPFRLDHRWLFCYLLSCWSHLSSSHLTECGFHLSNMVLISLSWVVLSEPARCWLDWVVQMHAVGRTVYLENLNSHCLNNFPVKCTASFNYWSLKWGSIKMNDLH